MGELEDVANGIRLALAATLARLEQEPGELLRLINSATPPELAQAVAYLSDMYQDSLVMAVGEDRDRAIEVFKGAMANGGAARDVMGAQMRLMERGGDNL